MTDKELAERYGEQATRFARAGYAGLASLCALWAARHALEYLCQTELLTQRADAGNVDLKR